MLKTSLAAFALLLVVFNTQANDPADTSTWVEFSSFGYAGKTGITPKPGEFLNPIIAGFYPDPSLCRVGSDYYLVNSSFQYFPGIPIWHSRDLVHWTQICNVIDRSSQYPAKGGPVQNGMYAPTIRFHDGTFYVVCTLVGGHGNFYVTSKDPKGPWSDPIFLPGVGGMDPSFFFDDDGRCYACSCDEPPNGRAEYNGHRTIRLEEVDLAHQRTTGEQTIIVNGGTDLSKHPIWCEGPHLYKINGIYYLMCAQGGTGIDHSEVIFKADSIRGPYVPCPANPMMTARDLPMERPNPVTCTGHADLVQTQNGEWFAVFLGCQPYQNGFYNTGRETFLLPVKWANGWPSILPPRTPVPLTPAEPKLPEDKAAIPTTGDIAFVDNFDSDVLAFRWVELRAPTAKWLVTSKTAKALFLEPRAERLSGQGNPSYLAIRQQNNNFACSVTLAAEPQTVDCIAGLAAFQNEGHYYAIDVKIASGHLTTISLEQSTGGEQPGILVSQKLPDNIDSIDLKIEGAGPEMRFFYKNGAGKFIQLGENLRSSYLILIRFQDETKCGRVLAWQDHVRSIHSS